MTANGDCDDGDVGINPGIVEVCDGTDNNCDGGVDEGHFHDGGMPIQMEICLETVRSRLTTVCSRTAMSPTLRIVMMVMLL